ncbi:MAG: hypothetical protein ACRD6X_05005 [Pyrinomonadaceae bacterium]
MTEKSNEEEMIFNADETDRLIAESLAKLDAIALGISIGTLFALVIFLATNILILKGGDEIGRNLSLLNQYFIGYDVSFWGSLVGLVYGFATGLVLGFLIAFLRNFIVSVYMHILRLKGSMSAINDYIDNP